LKIIQTFLFETDFLWPNKTKTIIYLQKIAVRILYNSTGTVVPHGIYGSVQGKK
jgi:hypothetical protein